MKHDLNNREQTGQNLGVVFITLILIIFLLNFFSLRILDSARKNQKISEHSFHQLMLLGKLESLIQRQFKEASDFITLGNEELKEFDRLQSKVIAAFTEIKSFNLEHLSHESGNIIKEHEQVEQLENSYLALSAKTRAFMTKAGTANQLDNLRQLQDTIENDFEETFTELFEKTVLLEKKELENINNQTHEQHIFESNLAWSAIGISIIFSFFAYRNLRASLVSRNALELTNEALQLKIQEKQDSDKKVHRERKNLYNMLDFLPMAFHLQAPDYTIPFANKVFRERFGSPDKRMCYEIMHNRSQPCEVCTTFKVFDHGKDETSVWEGQDGRDYITVCTPFTDIDGNPLVMEMALDITDQENAKKEAIQAKEEAEKANKVKSEFMARMSHELRTPLNAILGFGQLLDMDKGNALKPNQKNNVGYILKAGQHLLELVNEVLDLAKIESGKMSLSIENVRLSSLVSEMLKLFQPMMDEKELNFHITPLEPPEAMVLADQVRLKQVLLNLISNAIKYNRPKGSITIICKNLNEENIQINVQDTGIGISPENQKKIFKPFHRVGSKTESIEGTGIGLSISRQLVQLMNGSLEVQSKEGKGSCFYLILPKGKGLPSIIEI